MDLLLYGLKVTVFGMGVVFVALYVLYLLLSFFSILFGSVEKRAGAEATESREKKPEIVAEGADRETVAVITATVASLVDGPIAGMKIRRMEE